MPTPDADQPARRPRYRGTHPRRFQEKYKELQPERYPEEIEKVLQGGKTPAGMHRPILVEEVLRVLALKPGDLVVDGTLGYGGHAREFLRAVLPGGRLFGFDVDPLELPQTEARLRSMEFPQESLRVWRQNFAGIAQVLAAEAQGGADALFVDLGVSSMQLDNPARGFSYKAPGPLDMRMNPTRGPSAAELLAKLSLDELTNILTDHADEPHAAPLAHAILQAQARQPLTTTQDLASVLRTAAANLPPDDIDPLIRRVFQALRIAVNREFESLDAFLRQLPWSLKPGGRVAVLTFHSGEDRRVKAAFRSGLETGLFAAIAPEVLRPSPAEQHANPRSSSAKLRWAVRATEET